MNIIFARLLPALLIRRASKSELKKRQKQRQLEEKKAEKRDKAAATPAHVPKEVSAEEQEAELTPDVCITSPHNRVQIC